MKENTIKTEYLDKIPTSNKIKAISSPIIDFLNKTQFATSKTNLPYNTQRAEKTVLTEKQITDTVENYFKNPEKFSSKVTYSKAPISNISNIVKGADELSTIALAFLSELALLGYGYQALGYALDHPGFKKDGEEIVQIARNPLLLFKKKPEFSETSQFDAHDTPQEPPHAFKKMREETW
jgi:hypothetical protein